MSFLHPEFIYYMLIPLFILFALLITQKESQEHYFSQDVMDKLRASSSSLTLRVRNIIFLFVGTLIVLSLAEPVIDDGYVEVKAKSADIMMAIDISDSMMAEDVYPNRLELAKQKALTLLNESPNERIGIVAFAKNSYLVSPLSFDTPAVAFLLNKLDTTYITEKGTDFIAMLDIVGKSQAKNKKKYLLIISDGGDKSDFSKEIEIAKKQGIIVFVLGIGTQKGAPIKLKDGTFIKHNGEIIVSKLNESISDLAIKTGGVYIEGSVSDNDIKTMFREISNISDEKELKSERVPRYIPLFYYPLGLAIFLLLIATSSFYKRVNVNSAVGILVVFLLFSNSHVDAGVLDFIDLKNAKEAYNNGDFEKSANLYNIYADKSSNANSYYNAGNSFYKQEKYKEAIASYKKAKFENEDLKAKNYSNLGNAYVKEATGDSLQKAIESYEKSLEIKDDKETRDNLEAVKKFLEEQKSNSKEDNNQENQDNNSSQNNEDNNKKENSNQKSKDKDNKNSNNSKESEQNSSDERNNSNNENTKDKEPKENKSDNKKEEKETDEQKSKTDESKLDDNKPSNMEAKKEDIESSVENNVSVKADNINQISDAEEKKWIKRLNSNSNTYLYKLNNSDSEIDNTDEKPW